MSTRLKDSPAQVIPAAGALPDIATDPAGWRERIGTCGSSAAPVADDRRMLTVSAFCRRYSIGHTTAYAEMKAGHLRFCKVGSRRLIRVDDAEAWSWSKRQPAESSPVPAANPRIA